MELLSKYVEFKNGKKRPISKGIIPVYGGNGILDYTNTANMQSGVVIGRVGVYCGSVFLVREECWVSDNAIKAMCKENMDLGYLYYLLSSLHLNERRIGTSQPLLTQNILNNIEVEIPELAIQKKISSTLEFYENEELIAITKELADTLRRNKTIDWQKRESARAKMRMLIKKLLKKHKYPPEGMEDAVQTVMTQCELWTDNNDMGEEKVVDFRKAGYTYMQEKNDVLMVAEKREVYGDMETKIVKD